MDRADPAVEPGVVGGFLRGMRREKEFERVGGAAGRRGVEGHRKRVPGRETGDPGGGGPDRERAAESGGAQGVRPTAPAFGADRFNGRAKRGGDPRAGVGAGAIAGGRDSRRQGCDGVAGGVSQFEMTRRFPRTHYRPRPDQKQNNIETTRSGTFMKRQLSHATAAAFAAVCLLQPCLSQAQNTVTNGLVAHLKFEDNYTDSAGNVTTAAAVGAPKFEAGLLGKAVHIITTKDGATNDYVTLGYPAVLKFGSDATSDTVDFSFAFWAKVLHQADDQAFIGNKDWGSGGNKGWVIASEPDGMKWNLHDDGGSGRRDSPHVAPAIEDGSWHHIAVTFQRTNVAKVYLDGALVNTANMAPDAGVAVGSLDTDDLSWSVNLGQDGTGLYTDGGSAEMDFLMDDLGAWRRLLTDFEISRIYSAGRAGFDLGNIPAVTSPVVTSTTPTDGSTKVSPAVVVSATIAHGGTPVNTNTVQLWFDSNAVTPSVQKVQTNTIVQYDPPGLLLSQSAHTVRLIFSDNGTPATTKTNDFGFTVATYTNKTLPAPIYFENFESVTPGGVPAGWTVTNNTDSIDGGLDLGGPRSDSYLNWLVITRDQVFENGTNSFAVW